MQASTVKIFIVTCLNLSHLFFAQKTCPKCGTMDIPYPLSTSPNCGDPNYALVCDTSKNNIYFPALNGSSYVVLNINSSMRHITVQPPPWLPGTCTTQDMRKSEGIWLNESLPFNITSSNTIFLFNCSPRLLISPLNCSATSLCHEYLNNTVHVDPKVQAACMSWPGPCCTFLAGGSPSAYKIRLHASGCGAFRSILHIDPEEPPNKWSEGLEIQWAPPPEPICQTQFDCSQYSTCTREPNSSYTRCHCNMGYSWDQSSLTCLHNDDIAHHRHPLHEGIVVLIVLGILGLVIPVVVLILIKNGAGKKLSFWSMNSSHNEQHDLLKTGGRSARMFTWKEL